MVAASVYGCNLSVGLGRRPQDALRHLPRRQEGVYSQDDQSTDGQGLCAQRASVAHHPAVRRQGLSGSHQISSQRQSLAAYLHQRFRGNGQLCGRGNLYTHATGGTHQARPHPSHLLGTLRHHPIQIYRRDRGGWYATASLPLACSRYRSAHRRAGHTWATMPVAATMYDRCLDRRYPKNTKTR